MPILWDSTDELVRSFEIPPLSQTAALLAGGFGGMVLTEGIMRGLEKWTKKPGPKGFTRALLLGGGWSFGIILANGLLLWAARRPEIEKLAFVEET